MKKYILYITLLFSVNLISQELNLKGQVFEKETDIPLAGATIQVVGSELWVISDFDGNFEILLKIGDNIQISYIGKKTIELPILTSPISIYLETDLNELDEVTVSVGYFDISEKDLSGSITQIKSEQLEKWLFCFDTHRISICRNLWSHFWRLWTLLYKDKMY